jgi:hydroxypyruvate isomerase
MNRIMKRRNFVGNTMAAFGLWGVAGSVFSRPVSSDEIAAKPFRLNYAPHDGMFASSAGKDFVDQIKFMHEQGFTAVEDNGMLQRSVADQEKIGKTLSDLGMKMGVFVVDGGDNWKISLTTGKQEFKDTFVKTCKQSVEVAKRVNAKWMTVVPGFFENHLPIDIQTANVIDAFRAGAAIFEPHGLVMVMEPLSDTPELFLRSPHQSYMICKAVNSPACKILYDIFHMQRNEGNIIPNMDTCWDEIGYIQIGDNPNRKEPGTGELNYKNIFKFISEKKYTGILGMEHGNSIPGKDGELAVIKAYRDCDNF